MVLIMNIFFLSIDAGVVSLILMIDFFGYKIVRSLLDPRRVKWLAVLVRYTRYIQVRMIDVYMSFGERQAAPLVFTLSYTLDLSPSNSHIQDHVIFRVSRTKPSFATTWEGDDSPTYTLFTRISLSQCWVFVRWPENVTSGWIFRIIWTSEKHNFALETWKHTIPKDVSQN